MKKTIKYTLIILAFLLFSILLSYNNPIFAELSTTQNENLNYDRDAARNYALQHYATGTYNSSFHDYNGEGGDCTNFASQVLAAGGMSQQGIVGYIDYANWYYHFDLPTQISNSWINAHVFRKHWAHDLEGVGTNRAYLYKRDTITHFKNNPTTTKSIFTTLTGGDIIQLTLADGTSYHSAVVTKFAINPTTKDFDFQYVQHSTDKMGYLSDLLETYYNLGQGDRDFIAIRIRK